MKKLKKLISLIIIMLLVLSNMPTGAYAMVDEDATYTVTFKNEDGTVISQETYGEGDTIIVPANPKKSSEMVQGDILTDTPGSYTKYIFSQWNSDGNYSIESEVESDMIFIASFDSEEIPVYFSVLNRGLEQPDEIGHYAPDNYSDMLLGKIYYFITVSNNDLLVSLDICTQPTKEELEAVGVVLGEGEYIKWYVIKAERDGFHVDGIISNAKTKVTINYVDENGESIAESYINENLIVGDIIQVESPEVDKYTIEDADTYSVINIKIFTSDEVVINVPYTLNTYTVNFYNEDESLFDSVEVVEGEDVDMSLIGTPEKDDLIGYDTVTKYQFAGWMNWNVENIVDDFTNITADLDVYATFEDTTTDIINNVTFLDVNGDTISSVDVKKGTGVVAPSVENYIDTDENNNSVQYNFIGWMSTETEEMITLDTLDVIEKDMILQAVFEKIESETETGEQLIIETVPLAAPETTAEETTEASPEGETLLDQFIPLDDGVDTGDHTNVYFYIGAGVIAVLLLGAVSLIMKKKEN